MSSEKTAFKIIGLLSFCVLSFLFWLIYFKTESDLGNSFWINKLPALNAILNSITAIFLIAGRVAIKLNRVDLHKRLMISASVSSVFFLVSYVTYHNYHGDTKFLAEGIIRPIYFAILISHILLSMVQVPLILGTLYLARVKNFILHRKLARITFPIWLYVSVTGVCIFFILNFFNQPF